MPTNAGSLQLLKSEDGCVLLDIQHDRMLKLNLVAAEMWTLISNGHAESEIVSHLAERYGVSEDRVATDLSDLMRRITELEVGGIPLDCAALEVDSGHYSSHPSYPWYGTAPSEDSPRPTAAKVLIALFGLAIFDLVLSLFSLQAMCRCVRSWPRWGSRDATVARIGALCNAVHMACVWYPAKTLCLQRSAVTTWLMRIYGLPAVMKIGVRPTPFQAHAWVEVDGSVVNDWPRVKQFYRVLLSN